MPQVALFYLGLLVYSIEPAVNVCAVQHSAMEHGQLESIFPVAWPAIAVRYRQDQDGSFHFSINHQERKTGELEFAGAMRCSRPAMRCFEDSVNHLIKFCDKSCCGQSAVLMVPARSRDGLFDRGRMKGE